MKAKTLALLFSLSLITAMLASPVVAQVTVQLGAGGGLRTPMGSCSGATTDYYAGYGYGLSSGYTLQAKGRIGLGGFTLTGGVEYGRMNNSGEAEPGRGWVDLSQSIFTIKAGPEISFSIPASPLTPYFGANLAWHSISGRTTFVGVSRVPSGSFDIETASRIGIGFSAGAVIKLGGGMSLDLGAEYALVNLLGKGWTVAVPTSDARLNSYLSLNDTRDPLYAVGNDRHFVGGTRSISMIQMTAALMFGL